MQVRDVMTKNPDLTHPNTAVRDAARAMRDDNVGALPVGENDRLVGMVTDRDIAVRAAAEDRAPGDTTVREVMSEHAYWCFEEADLGEAARTMAEHQVHRLPVLNADKRLVGILAVADLARNDPDALVTAMKGIDEPTGQPRR